MGPGKNSDKQASLWHSLIGLMDEVGTLLSSRGKELFSVGEQHSLIARFSQGCSGLLILSTFCEIVNDSLKFWFLDAFLKVSVNFQIHEKGIVLFKRDIQYL